MSLMVSISGIRGIVGESLTPDVLVRYAAAYAEYCRRKSPANPEIVIGRDGRITGKFVANIVSSTLIACGMNVRALGICPTPTIALAVERGKACGGISVTASHNPMEWNGLKFFAPTGLFLDSRENEEFWRFAGDDEAAFSPWDSIGLHVSDDSWIRHHVNAILESGLLNVDRVRRCGFKVVVDCINAAGGRFVPALLRELGCSVTELNCDVSGVFAHPAEPIPENLVDLAARVKEVNADLGIAVDPDVDRLVLITEKGEPFGEEYSIAAAVKFVLALERSRNPEKKHTVVVNLSTTRAVEDIAGSFGATTLRTPVGEINVAKKMREVNAVIGGEGSGGIILPAVHTGRDAIVGIALLLQMLADHGGTLSELKATLPEYHIRKGKIQIGAGSLDHAIQAFRDRAGTTGRINMDDGLRVDFDEHWVHLRKSNTEPIVRIIAEARTPEQAQLIVQDATRMLMQSAEGTR